MLRFFFCRAENDFTVDCEKGRIGTFRTVEHRKAVRLQLPEKINVYEYSEGIKRALYCSFFFQIGGWTLELRDAMMISSSSIPLHDTL